MKRRQSPVMTFFIGVVFSLVAFVTPIKAQITFLYTVNTTSDVVAGDACVMAQSGCSLRGAIQAANATGPSTIIFGLPASDPLCDSGICTINLSSALPDLIVNMEFDGPGADRLTIKPVTGGQFRVFRVANIVTVTFFALTISNGIAAGDDGGGIKAFPSGAIVNVINCTISGNQSTKPGFGGGISNAATMNVINSTISDNHTDANGSGGGIYNTSIMKITNSTISGNTSGATVGLCSGGGILNANFSSSDVTNSTISGNTANGVPGGGICNLNGTLNVKNSIIALNTAAATGMDVYGNFVSAGFNLIGKTDGSAGFTAATDLTGTIASPLDPGLNPAGLQNNGGPMKTIALVFGSLAIDKGTSLGLTGTLTNDQRGAGFPRNFDHPTIPNAAGGDGTDIGAFELGTVIGGTITYGNAVGAPPPRFVSNVAITANGSPTVTATTAAPGATAGQYSLTGFGAGAYTVTPTKTGGVNGAISSFDAGRIALHVAGPPNPQLTATQLLAADVSGNGIVTSFDAAMIAKFVAGPPYAAPGIGSTGTWKFNPVNRNYASVGASITGEDYTALLMGEVSGNWTNTGARTANGFNPAALSWLLTGGF